MKHKYYIFIILLCLLILSLTALPYNADKNDSISLYDYHNARNYAVSYSDSLIKIDSSEGCVTLPYNSENFDCFVYNDVFVFLGSDPLNASCGDNEILTVFDSQTRYISSFLTDKRFNLSPTLFACDENYNIYLCDKEDSSVLYKFSASGDLSTLSCSVPILQIMCVENEALLLFTNNGIYTENNNSLSLFSDSLVCTPCAMKSENEFISSDSKDYRVENGILNEISKATETEAPDTVVPEDYKISVNDNLIFANQGITVTKLRNSLKLKSDEMVVYKVDGKVISSGRLGTGMRVLYDESEKTVIIKGDLTGEGNVNSRDLKLMMKFITGEKIPDNLQSAAGNLDSDNEITIRDLLFLAKMY